MSRLSEDLAQPAAEDRKNTEKALTLRAVSVLRFCCLLRGIDLERAKGKLHTRETTWVLTTRIKGQVKEGNPPVSRMEPTTICLQAVLSAYRMTSMEYEGKFLFVYLKRPPKLLSAETNNSMNTNGCTSKGSGISPHTAHG